MDEGKKERSLAEEEGAEKQHGLRRVCGHKHANEHRRGLAATAEGVPGGGNGDGWRGGGRVGRKLWWRAGIWRPACVFNIQTCRKCLWSAGCINVCMNKELGEAQPQLRAAHLQLSCTQRRDADWLLV